MKVVSDTNVIVGAVLLDKQSIWNDLEQTVIVAPDLIFAELGHVLLKYVRLRQYPRSDALKKLSIATAMIDEVIEWRGLHRSVFDLAHNLTLSYYDAIYLQICLEYHLPIFSFDKKLMRAATQLNIEHWSSNQGRGNG